MKREPKVFYECLTMPPRLVSVAILIYWSVAAFWLLTWEVLPELGLGYPPDLRAIAAVGNDAKPVKWSIDVIEDPRRPEVHRTVGQAVTTTTRMPDQSVDLSSHVTLDAGELLKAIPFANNSKVRLNIASQYHVDHRGNLQTFDILVSAVGTNERLLTVSGRLLEDAIMEVTSKGVVPMLNRSLSFPYEKHGVVSDALRPLDRLPGLNVGQRWETRMINPFTGAVESVRVEVLRRRIIDWNGEAVSAFEVVQHAGSVSAKTWVRLDGMILRQEVPLPFFRMILERSPDEPGPASDGKGAP